MNRAYLYQSYQDISNLILKPMKCAIQECENEARAPFKACSMNHGSYLNVVLTNLQSAFSARNPEAREGVSLEKAQYYGHYQK